MRLQEDSARTVANVIVGAAALGAAFVILRTPALRRLAFGLARTALTVTIPAWLSHEIHQAWAESARMASEGSDVTAGPGA